MRMAKQRRLEIFLIFTSIASTMLVMQRLWNQTNNCDSLCKVMKEITYLPPSTTDHNSSSRLCLNGRNNLSEMMTTTTTTPNYRCPPTALSIASAAAAASAPAASSSAAPLSASVPFSRFEKHQPKLLAILTYQRCGSTFFGSLFNHNPNAFYMFEPLDSLYSSLYGTKMGWNVPSDIANHRNGTHRVLPDVELEKVFEFLRSLFSCEVGSLPTETLVHPYIHDIFSREFSVNRNYVLCVRKHRRKIDKCMQSLPWTYCGGRFGETSQQRLDDCRRLLGDDDGFRRQNRHSKQFDDYLACRGHLRAAVDQKCSPMLAYTCRNRQLRVIKLVRASMDSMGPLLDAFPNFRVIHLVRDPRAVTLSRKNFDSSARGLYTESDRDNQLTREAILYCRTVVRDVEARRRLEKLHPGKIYTVIYDDMVKNLKLYSQNVYHFLDANSSMPLTWIKQISAIPNVRRALDKATRWQNVLTAETNGGIVGACREFFQTVAYDWPKMK